MNVFAFWGCTETEQPKMQTDQTFVISEDISSQSVTCFAEDALGHIWMATVRGANKHNVHEFHQYFSSDDSSSISGNQALQIFRDSRNRLWFCTTEEMKLRTGFDGLKNKSK